MTNLMCQSVAAVNFDAFTTAFNRAYSDYFMPIVMTPASFRGLIQRDDLSLDASVAALDDGAIVGTGLLGIRGTTGWIGGMGVIPERRRQGIGRLMMAYLLDQARAYGLTHIRLEVIEDNHAARSLYDQLGFEAVRFLDLVDCKPDSVVTMPNMYKIEPAAPAELLDYFAAFHSTANCWQRDLPSLHALELHMQGWAAMEGGRTVGYALGWANDIGIRLVDIGADTRADGRGIIRSLLGHLHQQYPEAHGSMYNIAGEDPALQAFRDVGYHTVMRQIEMTYAL